MNPKFVVVNTSNEGAFLGFFRPDPEDREEPDNPSEREAHGGCYIAGDEPAAYYRLSDAVRVHMGLQEEYDHTWETARIYRLVEVPRDEIARALWQIRDEFRKQWPTFTEEEMEMLQAEYDRLIGETNENRTFSRWLRSLILKEEVDDLLAEIRESLIKETN